MSIKYLIIIIIYNYNILYKYDYIIVTIIIITYVYVHRKEFRKKHIKMCIMVFFNDDFIRDIYKCSSLCTLIYIFLHIQNVNPLLYFYDLLHLCKNICVYI